MSLYKLPKSSKKKYPERQIVIGIAKKNIAYHSPIYENNPTYIDPRNKKLGAKIVSKNENVENVIKKLSLKKININKYYTESFDLGIPQVNLNKLKDKIFGIENNLDELGGIDF